MSGVPAERTAGCVQRGGPCEFPGDLAIAVDALRAAGWAEANLRRYPPHLRLTRAGLNFVRS